MIRRAGSYVGWFARFDSMTCESIARDAMTWAWEECSAGRLGFATKKELSDSILHRAHAIASKERIRSRNHISYETSSEYGVDYNKALYPSSSPPRQIEIRYSNEIAAAIKLLPMKQRRVMELLIDGLNSVDISARLGIPIHTCIRRIREGRMFMFHNGLIEVGIQGTGVPS